MASSSTITVSKCAFLSTMCAAAGAMIGIAASSATTINSRYRNWIALAILAALLSAVSRFGRPFPGYIAVLAIPLAIGVGMWYSGQVSTNNEASPANEVGFRGTCSSKAKYHSKSCADGCDISMCADQTQTMRIDPTNCPKDAASSTVNFTDLGADGCAKLGGQFIDPMCSLPICESAYETTNITLHAQGQNGCANATLSGVDPWSCRSVGGLPTNEGGNDGCILSLCQKN